MSEALLQVRVQPGASKDEVLGFQGEVLRLRVTATPDRGQANEAVVRLLAATLGIAKGRIAIVRGATARTKLVAFEGLSPEDVRAKLLRGEQRPGNDHK